jgi:hypothetical protein
MSKKPDTKAFLAALQTGPVADDLPQPSSQILAAGSSQMAQPAAETAPVPTPQTAQVHEPPRTANAPAPAKKSLRSDLKHFGGYLDDATLEKIALLRIRLKKDNSELIKFAIEELDRKHNAKRAFGDA